jgi:hypothetical protein
MNPRWKVDANTPATAVFDSRALIERDDLGQWDLRDPKTGRFVEPIVVIESVELFVPGRRRMKKVGRDTVPEPLNKYKIHFVGKRKFFICGATNRKAIESMYGFNMLEWIGQRIQLYVDPHVTFGKRKTGGLRVRTKRPDGQPSLEPLDNAVDRETEEQIEAARQELGFIDGDETGGEEGQ